MGPPPQSVTICEMVADSKERTCQRTGSRRGGRRLTAGCTSQEDRLSPGNERALRCDTPEGVRGRGKGEGQRGRSYTLAEPNDHAPSDRQ